jgi:predicted nucleic acid-binding Zn ribbon protein
MENMREMLRRSLGRSLGTMPALDRLTAAWQVACGTAMARRGVVLGFEDGVLRVEVADLGWLQQMRGMQAVLEHEVARIAEVKPVAIHFELKKSSR